MEIQDNLRRALKEPCQTTRLLYLLKGLKLLTLQIPYPQIIDLLQSHPGILKYLLLSVTYELSQVSMILDALQERYKSTEAYIKVYLTSVQMLIIDHEEYYQINYQRVKEYILDISEQLFKNAQLIFNDSHLIINGVNNFYKQFIQFNAKDDQLLKKCFGQALLLRSTWRNLKEKDPLFEQEIEECTLNNILELIEIQNHSHENLDDSDQVESIDHLLKESKQYVIESWLFYPTEIPLISSELVVPIGEITDSLFQLKQNVELLLSMLLLPQKYQQEYPFNVPNIEFKQKQRPTFRENVNVDIEIRSKCIFRANRAFLALTQPQNHLFINNQFKDYYKLAYSMIYEALSSDQILMEYNPGLLINYLQFLLYCEPEISIYFILFNNIVFNLVPYFDYKCVWSFFYQFTKLSQSTYYTIPQDQHEIIWKYLQITDFFSDIQNLTLFKDSIDKSSSVYKPPGITQLVQKPDFTTSIKIRLIDIEDKQLSEEILRTRRDIDNIQNMAQSKQLKVVHLFQQMIDQSQLKQSINTKVHYAKKLSLQIPLQQFTKNQIKQKQILSPEGNNIFSIIKKTISNSKNIFKVTQKPYAFSFQTEDTRPPTGSQTTRSIRKYPQSPRKSYLNQLPKLYPLDLKDFQQQRIEDILTPEFIENSNQNERFTKGILNLILFLSQDLISQPIAKSKLKILNIQFDIVMKNYLFKQQHESQHSSCVLAGKLCNLMIKDQETFPVAEFKVLCKISLDLLLKEQITTKVLLIMETLQLITQYHPNNLIHIPVTLWHLLFQVYSRQRKQQIFANYFIRILRAALLHRNQILHNRLYLKLNIRDYFKRDALIMRMLN